MAFCFMIYIADVSTDLTCFRFHHHQGGIVDTIKVEYIRMTLH